MGIGNWKIGVRLAAGLGLALAFMVGIAATGIANLGRMTAPRISPATRCRK